MKKVVLLSIFLSVFSLVKAQQKLNVPADLQEQSKEYRKEIIKVTDGIYMAVGYGIANSILIEGTDGVIVIDVLESPGAAKEVKAEFEKITKKPVKAIIYTHNHTDHIQGASVFAGNNAVEIYAHQDLYKTNSSNALLIRPILEKRSLRMFGAFLQMEDELVNCGLGSHLNIKDSGEPGFLKPTKTFEDSLQLTIAGVKMMLFHAPGETDDQINVWLPDKKVLCIGDNLYRTFPNLYTIRGTTYRDPVLWYRSLDKVRYLNPDFLVPSHSRPLIGATNIQDILTTYRDGIQFVHDQTIRLMNSGKTPDEIAHLVKLPEHLSQSPFLKEFYGKASWSAKSIFAGTLGFFDGNPTNLQPLAPLDKAEKMAKMAGGKDKLAEQCLAALQQKDYQWCLELSDYLLRLDPNNNQYIDARTEALMRLGEAESNPNARHYYLTAAKELKGLTVVQKFTISPENLRNLPIMTFFNNMAVNIKPEKAINMNKKMHFIFTDEVQTISVIIRKGIAEVQPFPIGTPDITITTTTQVWKEIVSKIKSPMAAFSKGELKISAPMEFQSVMKVFQD